MMTAAPQKILVGMSGGVDSAVTAALLVEAGHEVAGAFLQLWSEDGIAGRENACCSIEGMELARRTAAKLGIPLHVLNVRERFKERIVDPWLEASFSGQTPNPCLSCNREVKIGHLLDRARDLGFDSVATGHYARVEDGALFRGVDPVKDQSYFLARLSEAQLRHAHFPLGGMTKPEVRALAAARGMAVATKRESQELSFIADDIPSFLARHAEGRLVPGTVRDVDGRTYPQAHGGLALYTIGQRRGLPVSGTATPRYVLGRDRATNTLTVGEEQHLFSSTCAVSDLVLRGLPDGEYRLAVQIRSHHQAADAAVAVRDGRAEIAFDQPQRAVTPGQSAVLYDGARCMGAGTIL